MKEKELVRKHPKTVWEQVREQVERDIVKGVYSTAERIPSVIQLSQIYGISNNTAVRVLTGLRDEGIVVKKNGLGFFVMPYAKEKLIKKQETELRKKLNAVLRGGKEIGYDTEKLTSIVMSEIEQLT